MSGAWEREWFVVCGISDVDMIPFTVMETAQSAEQFAAGCAGRSSAIPVVPREDADKRIAELERQLAVANATREQAEPESET